jgi:hypothetical protein
MWSKKVPTEDGLYLFRGYYSPNRESQFSCTYTFPEGSVVIWWEMDGDTWNCPSGLMATHPERGDSKVEYVFAEELAGEWKRIADSSRSSDDWESQWRD